MNAERTQDILYGSNLDADDPTRLIVRNRYAYNEITEEWTSVTKQELSASYAIKDVAPKGLDHFYLLGKADNGDGVVERWKRKNVQPIGGSGNVTYARTELYRGQTLGPLVTLDVDPEARFLLLLHGMERKVSKLDLGSGALSTLYTPASVPLVQSLSRITKIQHATEGRVWILTRHHDLERLVLHDVQNDGVFESWEQIDNTEFNDRYGVNAEPGSIVRDFVNDF